MTTAITREELIDRLTLKWAVVKYEVNPKHFNEVNETIVEKFEECMTACEYRDELNEGIDPYNTDLHYGVMERIVLSDKKVAEFFATELGLKVEEVQGGYSFIKP